jgi:hypothetical protein
MTSFKKTMGPVTGFFKKASGDTQRFFKKGGDFQKGASAVSSGLGSASRVLGQGAKIGNQVLGAVEKSPFGGVLSPAIAAARAGVNVLSLAGKAADAGRDVSRDLTSGRSAKSIVGNTLERASALRDQVKGPQFA